MEALQHAPPNSNLHKKGGNGKIKICWTLKKGFSTEHLVHAWSRSNLQRANEKVHSDQVETAAVIQSASLLSLSAAAGIVKAENIAEITV